MSAHDEPCSRGCGARGAMWYVGDEWVCDACYRAENFYPGHWPTGDRVHFAGLCNDCTARYLASKTLEQAENWYRLGIVSQDLYEAYTHVWATASYRYGSVSRSWLVSPAIPEVVRLVAILRGELTLRRDAARLEERKRATPDCLLTQVKPRP